MPRGKKRTHSDDDDESIVAEIQKLLASNMSKSTQTQVETLLSTLIEHVEQTSSAVEYTSHSAAHFMLFATVDEDLLSLGGNNDNSKAWDDNKRIRQLVAEWFSISFARINRLTKAKLNKLDSIFNHVQDAVAVSIIDPLDDHTEVSNLNLSALRASLKKQEKFITADAVALLTTLRMASLNLFRKVDFDGFHTSVLLLELVLGTLKFGAASLIDGLREEGAIEAFLNENLEAAKAKVIRLATAMNEFQFEV